MFCFLFFVHFLVTIHFPSFFVQFWSFVFILLTVEYLWEVLVREIPSIFCLELYMFSWCLLHPNLLGQIISIDLTLCGHAVLCDCCGLWSLWTSCWFRVTEMDHKHRRETNMKSKTSQYQVSERSEWNRHRSGSKLFFFFLSILSLNSSKAGHETTRLEHRSEITETCTARTALMHALDWLAYTSSLLPLLM